MVTVILGIPGLEGAGSLLCCGHEVAVYDTLSGMCQRRSPTEGVGILSAVLLEGDRAIMSSRDGSLQVWTLSDLQCTWRVQADQTGPVWSCTPSNDGRVYTGGEDGIIRGWKIPDDYSHRAQSTMFQGMDDAAKASLMQTMNMVSDVDNLQCQMFAHQGGVRGVAAIQQTYNAAEVAFLARKPPWEMDGGPVLAEKERRHSAGGQLVSYGADCSVCVWDLEHMECRWRVSCVLPCCLIVNHRNGQYFSGTADGSLKCWDVVNCSESSTEVPVAPANSGSIHQGCLLAVAVFPDGRVATGAADGVVKMWDLHPLRPLVELRGHATPVYSLSVLPNPEAPSMPSDDNSLLVSRSQDGHCIVWDPISGAQISRLRVK